MSRLVDAPLGPLRCRSTTNAANFSTVILDFARPMRNRRHSSADVGRKHFQLANLRATVSPLSSVATPQPASPFHVRRDRNAPPRSLQGSRHSLGPVAFFSLWLCPTATVIGRGLGNRFGGG